jgi:uncharacterized FlgJ-related protein
MHRFTVLPANINHGVCIWEKVAGSSRMARDFRYLFIGIWKRDSAIPRYDYAMFSRGNRVQQTVRHL